MPRNIIDKMPTKLKLARVAAGYSQKDFSEKIFMNQNTYSRHEGNPSKIPTDKRILISNELNNKDEDLFEEWSNVYIANNKEVVNSNSFNGIENFNSKELVEVILSTQSELSNTNKSLLISLNEIAKSNEMFLNTFSSVVTKLVNIIDSLTLIGKIK